MPPTRRAPPASARRIARSKPVSSPRTRGPALGIASEASTAAGCARAFVAEGAELAATYLNDKARPHVSAVTDLLGCKLLVPCDVRIPGQLEAAFERIRTEWGQLDFLLHAIAF